MLPITALAIHDIVDGGRLESYRERIGQSAIVTLSPEANRLDYIC